jgi:putative lipoprotein
MARARLRGAAILSALAMTGCTTGPPPGPLPDGLAGTDWIAKTVAGRKVPAEVAVTMQFPEAGRIAGRSGCNRYTGTIGVGDGKLVIGPLATTRMACPEPQGDVEALFLAALQQAVRLRRDNRALVLETAAGEPSRFLPFTPP